MTDGEDGRDRSLWRRPGEEHANETKLHNYCTPYFRAGDEPGDGRSGERLTFFEGVPVVRAALANAPVVVLGIYAFLLAYAELTPLDGVSELAPPVTAVQVASLLAVALVLGLLLVLFAWLIADREDATHPGADVVTALTELASPMFFYGGLVVLLAGTLTSIALVTFADTVHRNVVFASDFFLLLYLTGPVVYDGILRTETLFNNIPDLDIITAKESPPDGGDGPVDSFWEQAALRTSAAAFDESGVIFLMSCLFVLPFAVLWFAGDGPFHTGSPLVLVLTCGLSVVIVALAVQFLVLNRVLYSLLTDTGTDAVALQYIPRHPDTTAGFRDLGRFASRVNVLLIVAVLYLANRLYVQGRLSFLLDGARFAPGRVDSFWLINYLLPVVVFMAVVFVWFYFSFWLMHSAMQREREQYLWDLPTGPDGNVTTGEADEVIQNGPVWPINQKLVVALLSADVVSLSIAASAFLV